MTHNTNVKRCEIVVTKQMTYKFGYDINLMAMEIKYSPPQQGDWIKAPHHFEICSSPRSS